MSTMNVDIPECLMKKLQMKKLQELADRDGIAPSQLVSAAVAEKVAAMLTEEYLHQRGHGGSREAFDGVLAKVPGALPRPGDEL